MAPIQLSAKEQDVLELLFVGKRDKEIAEALNVSTHTVKWHCVSLHKKFNANNRTEVIYKALQRGILKAPVPQLELPFT